MQGAARPVERSAGSFSFGVGVRIAQQGASASLELGGLAPLVAGAVESRGREQQMRKQVGRKEDEHVEVSGQPLSEATIPERDMGRNPTITGNEVIGDATRRRNPEAEAAAPKRRYYRVTKGAVVRDPTTGFRARIRDGKELDDANYDIASLMRQGVKLEEIAESEREQL
jgi:hypothetical protein